MVKTFAFALVTLGMLALAAQQAAADCGWYPFYGYRTPNYLAQPYVVVVQPSAPQVRTAYYPPSASSVAAPAPQYYYYSSPAPQGTGCRWYPFYGYRQPNLN
jgi:hypothetical protein